MRVYISITEIVELIEKHYNIENVRFMTEDSDDAYSECYCHIDFVSGDREDEQE